MSRRTITLVAPNGAKVRTVHSKQYFVVEYHEQVSRWIPGHLDENGQLVRGYSESLPEPKQVAKVLKRTDSPTAALTELRRHRSSVVFFVSRDGMVKTEVDARLLEYRSDSEKRQKKASARDATHRF